MGSHSSVPGELPDQCQPSLCPDLAYLNCLPPLEQRQGQFCVHNPPESTQWEILRTQEKPLGLMGGIRANRSKALSFIWLPRKKKARVPLSQKSRSEVFKPCPGIGEVGLQPLPAIPPPNSCIVTGPLPHNSSTTQPVERHPLPCPRTLITRALNKDLWQASLPVPQEPLYLRQRN